MKRWRHEAEGEVSPVGAYLIVGAIALGGYLLWRSAGTKNRSVE